jgi:hypothetical protein
MPGINPRPTMKPSFSAAWKAVPIVTKQLPETCFVAPCDERSLLWRRSGHSGHAHDSALGLLAVGGGGFAILAVQFELQ